LEWSQIQKGSVSFLPTKTQLRSLFDESITLLRESAKTKEIEIVLNISESLEIVADMNMLQTIIRNLVSNAIKFTQKGGQVSLAAKYNNDNCIEISIKDTGIGMSQNIIDDLFRIDIQTVRKGTEGELSTGLGLLLCKEFVEKHGGKIWIESMVGVGTTFNFSIPLNLENVQSSNLLIF